MWCMEGGKYSGCIEMSDLEHIIDAEMFGKLPPTEMTLEQLVQEEDLANTSVGESDDDTIVVGLKHM
jgi:hypothetical protein